MNELLIKRNASLEGALRNKAVLLTGGGGGIGLEAAKAFTHMGAKVIIAEIDRGKIDRAGQQFANLFNGAQVDFYEVDLAKENEVDRLCGYILEKYGCPDVLFNNATFVCLGSVGEVEMTSWDRSYAVNFRAPLLLTKRFLPLMKERNSGALVFVSSSGAAPYMGAYEVYKTSQVELSNTLAMELEHTNVHTYTVGPGLVKTETAAKAIEIVSAKMNVSVDAFYQMNSGHILDAESAGVGFALSVLNAQAYHGQEIGSIQVLSDFGLLRGDSSTQEKVPAAGHTADKDVFGKVQKTYEEQYGGWQAMNVFERQWVLRDFKKNMGLSADQALEKLKEMGQRIAQGDLGFTAPDKEFLLKLKEYWNHQLNLLQGYQKDAAKREEQTKILKEWISDIERLLF